MEEFSTFNTIMLVIIFLDFLHFLYCFFSESPFGRFISAGFANHDFPFKTVIQSATLCQREKERTVGRKINSNNDRESMTASERIKRSEEESEINRKKKKSSLSNSNTIGLVLHLISSENAIETHSFQKSNVRSWLTMTKCHKD